MTTSRPDTLRPQGSQHSTTTIVPSTFSSSQAELTPRPSKENDLEKGQTGQRSSSSDFDDSPAPRYVILEALHSLYDYLQLDVLTTYRQLWLLVVASNLIAGIVVITKDDHTDTLPLASCINASTANLMVAIIIRQDYIKNLMYHICWSVPHSAPLCIRNQFAKIYEHGGIHSGAAVSALLWFIVFTGFLWTTFTRGRYSNAAVLAFDIALAVLLLAITSSAIPQFRRAHHNVFENIHRWAGWFGIALFWIALVLFANDESDGQSLGDTLARQPSFWMLLITSLHIIYPWLSLRKVAVVRFDRLSDHAVRLYFSPKEKITALHGVNISDAPLREWHAFAAISDVDGNAGGATSAIISKAGDWTAKTVAEPKSYYYMRGQHVTGTLDVAQLFRSVVVMATGSGIGPVLALFGTMPQTKIRIIWSAASPRATFGDGICDAVLRQDPAAIIWDTRVEGQRRPDLTEMAYQMYHESGAESVFFISNRNLTRSVVRALRQRKVNVFAPIFDS